jgi:hypothetical protein
VIDACVSRHESEATEMDSIVGGRGSRQYGMSARILHVKRGYHWPNMQADIELYCRTCDACQHSKYSNQRTQGLLQPLATPPMPWHTITTDFVTGLPTDKSTHCDSVWVVDKLTKRAHFIAVTIATTKKASAKVKARLFLEQVVRLHGVPREIVSDRDPIFTSGFWTELMRTVSKTSGLSY